MEPNSFGIRRRNGPKSVETSSSNLANPSPKDVRTTFRQSMPIFTLSFCFLFATAVGYTYPLPGFDFLLSHQMYMLGVQTPTCPLLDNHGEPLSPGQLKLCHQYPELMDYVKMGQSIGMDECKKQFQFRRWNCSENLASDNDGLTGGTKEEAFRKSLQSAGIAYTIARACREDGLTSCGCGRSRKPSSLNAYPNYIWGGCDDNIRFGLQFAMLFTDIKEREKTYPRHSEGLAKMLQNLHNAEAGRRALKKRARVHCKCHGVSASCNLKTCWHQLQDFKTISQDMTEKYDAAAYVTFNKKGTKLGRDALAVQRREKRRLEKQKRRRASGNEPQRRNIPSNRYSRDLENHDDNEVDEDDDDDEENEVPGRVKRARNDRRRKNGRIRKRYARANYNKDDLIFTQQSPSYCEYIQGRVCLNDVRKGDESCQQMCCGRPVLSRTVRVEKKCNCEFKWCCEVKCQICSHQETQYYCS